MPNRVGHRNPELDWLRAYAVLLVVLFHLTIILAPGPRVFALFFGVLNFSGGVDLFFVISGFVIASSLEPLWQSPAAIRHAFVRGFFLRRFWRLWPASTLWISYCLLAAWWFAGTGVWPALQRVCWQWVSAIVPVYELQEFRHPTVLGYYWTLSVEWQFYLVFPYLLWGLHSRRMRAAALLALFLLGLVANQVSWMLRFASIVGGIAVYAAYRSGWVVGPDAPVTRYREFRLWLTPILLLVLVTLPQLGHSMLVGQLVLTALCMLLVAMAAAERELVGDCGIPRLLGWIGLRSYSLYLCHIPVALTLVAVLGRWHGDPLDRVRIAPVLLIAAALLMAMAAAHLSYRCVEIPLQRRFRPAPTPGIG